MSTTTSRLSTLLAGWKFARKPLIIGLVAMLALLGYNSLIESQLNQALEAEQEAAKAWLQTQITQTRDAKTELVGALTTLDSARKVRPTVIIRQGKVDTIRVGLPIDTLPRVMVTVDSVAYPTHVPVANALNHFKEEAMLVDTLVIPKVDTVLVRVDSLARAAEGAVTALEKKPHWLKRVWAKLKEHSTTFVVGVGTGAVIVSVAR